MMIRDIGRSVVTLGIWMLCAGIALSAVIGDSPSTADVTAIVVVPLIVALVATFMIWVAPELAKTDQLKAGLRDGESEKLKRGASAYEVEEARLRVLMDMMEPEERAAFKESMKRQALGRMRLTGDGEFTGPDLDSLMEDDYYRDRN